jgi:UDP-N-acetylmuramyl tripeptide synthase
LSSHPYFHFSAGICFAKISQAGSVIHHTMEYYLAIKRNIDSKDPEEP